MTKIKSILKTIYGLDILDRTYDFNYQTKCTLKSYLKASPVLTFLVLSFMILGIASMIKYLF